MSLIIATRRSRTFNAAFRCPSSVALYHAASTTASN
jgi:hypothetical protein